MDQKLLEELSAAKAAYHEASMRARAAAETMRQANEHELAMYQRYQKARSAVEDAA